MNLLSLVSAEMLPCFGEVGPISDNVARDVTVAGPVRQWCGERLSEKVLQIISVVGSHPAGVGPGNAAHTAGLREEVGVGPSGSLVRQGKKGM